MKKINILKKSCDFDRIIHHSKSYKYKDYIIYIERTNDITYHFGISVGKKIGNAVTRNRIKRQLKALISKKDYKNNFNCIIIVTKGILNRSFEEMETNYNDAIKNLDMQKEIINEEK